MDVDRFFSVGPRTPFQANTVFSNRESHLEAFQRRLHRHAAGSWPDGILQDFRRPASNIVVFYGEGGIGKSTLVRHLASTATGDDAAGLAKARASAVVDFADVANLSFESALLRVRAGLGTLGRSWPAFDVAFAVYWERKHPGEPLAAALARSAPSAVRESGDAALSEQVTATLDQFLGGLGLLGLGYQAASAVGRSAVHAARLHRLRAGFPPLDLLLDERDPDRMLGFLPVLLARDLEQHRSRKGALAVCVLDTFESVQALPPERGGIEDLVARLVYLMPNVLFVAASRRPLGWADPFRCTGLTYGGLTLWPGLDPEASDGDQFRLDGLDRDSAEGYLRARLTLGEGPAIPAQIRRRIVAGSAGSPHYLELAAGLFERMAADTGQVAEDAFGRPFPELVLRMMRDLGEVERDLLRAAALLEAFDAEVLEAVVPQARGRQVEDFMARSFIRRNSGVWPPYRLHENLRDAISACDEHTSDGWTEQEHRTAAEAAIGRLERIARSVWDGNQAEGSTRVVAAFLLALRAAEEHGLTPDELGPMAFTLRELGYWQVLASLREFDDRTAPELARLTAVCRLTADTGIHAETRHARMRDLAVSNGPYADLTQYELGNLAFFIGDIDAAQDAFASIRHDDTVIAAGARLGLAGIALRRSDYQAVRAHIDGHPVLPLDRARVNDLMGHVLLHNGRFAEAAEVFQASYDHAQQLEAPLWAARAARHLALALMWHDPQGALRALPQARHLNQSLEEHVGLAQCDMAEGLSRALLGDPDTASGLFASARAGFTAAGATYELLPIQPVEVLADLAAGRVDAARDQTRLLAEAAAQGRPLGPPAWAAITALWIGYPDPAFDAIAWLDNTDARSRWSGIVDRLPGPR